MDFSFEIQGAAMTGSINPNTMEMVTGIFGAFLGGLAMVWLTIYIAIMVFMIISRWKVFKKAGLPGRGILIPVYNRVLMFKIGGMSGRRAASILFPPLFLVAMIINYFNIAKFFGKHWTFGLGILFVKVVFIPILAFDNSEYLGKKFAKCVTKITTTPAAKASAKKIMKKVIKKAPAKKVVKKVKTLTKKK